MQVILRENIENLGRIGDVVNVSPGYARNFLLPRKLVMVADEGNVAAIEAAKKTLEKKRLAQLASSRELAAKIADFQVTIKRKVGEKDKLFGSVSSGDIAEVMNKAGYPIKKSMIHIDHPIKTVGVHPVSIKIEPEVTATVKVWVAKEE